MKPPHAPSNPPSNPPESSLENESGGWDPPSEPTTPPTKNSTSPTGDGPGNLNQNQPLVDWGSLSTRPEFGLESIPQPPKYEGEPQSPDKILPKSAWRNRVNDLLSTHPGAANPGKFLSLEQALELPNLQPGPWGSWRSELGRLREVAGWIRKKEWADVESREKEGMVSYLRLQRWMENRGHHGPMVQASAVVSAQILAEELPKSGWWGMPTYSAADRDRPFRLYLAWFGDRKGPLENTAWDLINPKNGEEVGTGVIKSPPFVIPETWWPSLVVPGILDGLVVQVKAR